MFKCWQLTKYLELCEGQGKLLCRLLAGDWQSLTLPELSGVAPFWGLLEDRACLISTVFEPSVPSGGAWRA